MTDKKENQFEEPVEIQIDPAEEAEAAENGDGELNQADEDLARAREDLFKHQEAMLRMQAETDNLRKRLMRDLEKSRKLALEKIMKDLLQVWDSIERGLDASGGSPTVESLKQGQELTMKLMEKVMQDHDLEVFNPLGQPFDPEFHQAMTMVPSDEVEENTVIEVLQKGFRLHDRLIRPAMVIVSKKP